MQLSIGDLANVTGETVKTLRYWTDQGLLDTERGETTITITLWGCVKLFAVRLR
jgi:hypothetical protein